MVHRLQILFLIQLTHVNNILTDIKVKLIDHSLGARVILSSLNSLVNNSAWNSNNYSIASVQLVGAAVDNEEVSKNKRDIDIDITNWNTIKSNYGQPQNKSYRISTICIIPKIMLLSQTRFTHLILSKFILLMKEIERQDKLDIRLFPITYFYHYLKLCSDKCR